MAGRGSAAPFARAAAFAALFVLFAARAAVAAVVTIDGAPVSGAVVSDGHLLVPFRAPMEAIGATVVWSDSDQTGTASYAGREIVRAAVGSPTTYVDGFPKALTVAPVLIEHLEYIPVELLPQISRARLAVAADGTSAAVTGFDLAGIDAVGADIGSGDAKGQLLYVWLWLLPIAALLCGAAYMILRVQLELDYRGPANRRRS